MSEKKNVPKSRDLSYDAINNVDMWGITPAYSFHQK